MEDEPGYDSRHVVGAHEIAAMLGLTRQRVNQMARERGFPRPYGVLHMGNVWKRSAVEAWAREHGRLISSAERENRSP